MTSESGSFMVGRSQMKYGRHVVESPACARHSSRRQRDGSTRRWSSEGVEIKATMKTILITGCSSGYGLETARHFHAKGWNVVATMRTPREDLLPQSERLRVLALDVTSPESIAAAVEAAGPIDVLVNNAGIGLMGAFEATPMETTREVFETNTFGTIAMTQAFLPGL